MPLCKRSAIGFACFFVAATFAAEDAVTTTPSSAPTGEVSAAPSLDPRADQRLKDMSDFLGKQQKFRFSVEITYDEVKDDGQKLQLGRRSHAEVMRPGGLRVESQGDRGWDQSMAFDGHHFLLHDKARKVYSRVDAPATLEQFFDFIFEKYGATPPLVDFLLPDVHGALTKGAQSSAMLGAAFVAEKVCDHLSFSGEHLDWQLWIEKGASPWPRKFVITYKDVDERPQFMAVFRNWEADPSMNASRFDTNPPAGASEIPLEIDTKNKNQEGA